MKVNIQHLSFLSDLIKKEQLLTDEEIKLISGLAKNDFSFASQFVLRIIWQISHQGTKTTKYYTLCICANHQ